MIGFRVDAAALQFLIGSPDVASIREEKLNFPSDASSNPVIGAPSVLASGLDGTGQVVVIADTGVQISHPFLAGRTIDGACFSTTDSTFFPITSLCPNGMSTSVGPFFAPGIYPGQEGPAAGTNANCPIALDGCEHGTHVAGIAAGKNYAGGPGFDGIAPNAKIIAIEVFSKISDAGACGVPVCIAAWDTDIFGALQWVYTRVTTNVLSDLKTPLAPLQIASINMSLGNSTAHATPCDDNPEKFYIDALRAVNVASVISAGNDGYPHALGESACVSSAISVGASTDFDTVAGFSNRADYLSIYAPGTSIDSSVPNNTYANLQGTSMSAPVVTGAWAVMRQKYPGKSVSEILAILQATGKPITVDGVTRPRINLAAAVGVATPPLVINPPSSVIVTNLNDSGAGSLRAVIGSAAAGATVSFTPGLTGTITLTSGEIALNKQLKIVGPGARILSVSGNDASRIFNITNVADVSISGLTITHGKTLTTTPGGGGILIDASILNLTDVTMSANNAPTANALGGAIDNEGGILNILRCTFSGNSAALRGGAINQRLSGTMTITDSTFVGNTTGAAGAGGAIRNTQSITTITASTIVGNTANAGLNISINQGEYILKNSIIAGGIGIGTTPGTSDVGIVAGFVNSADYNLIQSVDPTTIGGTKTHDIYGVAPNLGPLANNGGQTDTLLPNTGSPVIDKIPGAGACNSAATPIDQRSFARPFNLLCDIGAVEVGASMRLDTVGVFSNGTFYLRNSNTAGTADITVAYGTAGDLPATGDWNGDGVDTVGVFKPTYGVFLLRDSNTPGAPDYSFVLGNPGDTPLVGKWNATMTHDGVGVFRPSNGLIYLKSGLTTGFADYTMVLGNPGDKGIAGDWDGNGTDSIGVYRPANGLFYLSNSVAGTTDTPAIVFSDLTLVFGSPTGLPFAGDWTGSGVSRVGMAISGIIYQRNTLDTGAADNAFAYGPPDALPVAGHWAAGSVPSMVNNVLIQPAQAGAPSKSTSEPGADGRFD